MLAAPRVLTHDLAALRDPVLAERCRRDFRVFVRHAWGQIDPAPLVWNWHLDAMCLHLQAVTEGRIDKLLINIPPGHAKSMIVGVLWPAWVWTLDPAWRLLSASYDMTLSMRDATKARTLIRGEWYQRLFSTDPRSITDENPDGEKWALKGDQDVKSYYETTALGFRLCVSIGAGTGHRGDALVIDDPQSAEQAKKKEQREKVIRWKTETMSSRFNDQEHAQQVVIQQRLHEEDLAGFLSKSGEWVHLCLQSEYEDKTAANWPCKCPSCRAGHTWARPRPPAHLQTRRERLAWLDEQKPVPFWKDPRTKPGELMFPAKFSAKVIADAKKPRVGMGPVAYLGQHQQRPVADGGNIIQASWLGARWHLPGVQPFLSESDVPGLMRRPYNPRLKGKNKRRIMITDATFKKTDDSDLVAVGVLDLVDADVYLLDVRWERMTFVETVQAIVDLRRKWSGPTAGGIVGLVGVEDKANGTAVIEVLKRKVPGLVPLEPLGSKEARIQAAADFMHSGNVWLPEQADWVSDLVAEATAFPAGAHDDGIDMLAYGILILLATSGASWLQRLVKH